MRPRTILLLLAALLQAGPALARPARGRTRKVTIRDGDTVGHIAYRNGCTIEQLMAANKETLKAPDKIKPGQELRLPRCGGKKSKASGSRPRYHLVQSGESIWNIGARYGCTLKEMMDSNHRRLKDPRLIQIDQKLRVPRCGPVGKEVSKKGGTRGGATALIAGQCSWGPDDFEVRILRRKMLAAGFKAPRKFRAMVVQTRLSRDQKRVTGHRLLSYGRLAWEHWGWNPASTVKLYSAIGALEQVRRQGFGVGARVTFHYKKGDKTFLLKELFEEAVHLSKNIPHNRLVQLAGFDFLNGQGGTLQRAGLDHTYVMRAYAAQQWRAEGHSRWLRDSPPITLREGRKRKKLRARKGKGRYPCGGAACTSLSDLAKTMCRMMLHEQLPRHRRLRLGGSGQGPHLRLLRQAMDRKRKGRTDRVWDAFQRAFPPEKGYALFRKAGFSRDWLSENIYIYNPKQRRRWIVTMAGYPGRGSLTSAAKIIAELIRSGKLQ